MAPRAPSIHHCTSHPLVFFGRAAELALLDEALAGGRDSVVAMIGPGGQGKTAIVQHWLERQRDRLDQIDGVFLWSFYRGKDSDLCLRTLFAYAEGLDSPPEVSAGFCVDRLIPRLRAERWALVLDGAEIVQHESGAWFGRFVHPELGRLLEELASAPMPGVVVLTSRFAMPTLQTRRHARLISLATLDAQSGAGLLESLGVHGALAERTAAAESVGLHAKAVELLGAWLVRYHAGAVAKHRDLPDVVQGDASPEEAQVARILAAFHQSLAPELRDILALTTAFRQPPTLRRLLEYLVSPSVRHLLHDVKGRTYEMFSNRAEVWLRGAVDELVTLRLLERVGLALILSALDESAVLDAHPLVRRGFEDALGAGAPSAQARAGFLSGRPDRRPPASLAEAREEVELFHAYIEAGLWNEADNTLRALDNPKHRFLAPAFERDLLLQFFPAQDWRQKPLWPGFGRRRSLAICFELLGHFGDALEVYPATDAALRGDALIALGRLAPFVETPSMAHPWQMLWHAYRTHALAILGREREALALARSATPMDAYEWVHVFEAMLRLGQADQLDLRSLTPSADHVWGVLALRRMRADLARLRGEPNLGSEYRELLEAYDRAGLPWERALTRLSYARWLGAGAEREAVLASALELAQRFGMQVVEVDVREQQGEDASALRAACGYAGRARP